MGLPVAFKRINWSVRSIYSENGETGTNCKPVPLAGWDFVFAKQARIPNYECSEDFFVKLKWFQQFFDVGLNNLLEFWSIA